jgi:hypothetical protein
MSCGEWLGIAGIIASIVASGVSIWAHVRINKTNVRIRNMQKLSTSGSQSPIFIDNRSQYNIGQNIFSGGGNAPPPDNDKASPIG